ncbi:hypothetical protein ASG04_09850 [Curtobacterium sp. Leaf183]|nr:hypothetical protein ASG04_09850 [Curtobacterium sp. Leaf183]
MVSCARRPLATMMVSDHLATAEQTYREASAASRCVSSDVVPPTEQAQPRIRDERIPDLFEPCGMSASIIVDERDDVSRRVGYTPLQRESQARSFDPRH